MLAAATKLPVTSVPLRSDYLAESRHSPNLALTCDDNVQSISMPGDGPVPQNLSTRVNKFGSGPEPHWNTLSEFLMLSLSVDFIGYFIVRHHDTKR